MKKYQIILFQKYLRSHILNFGKKLEKCEFKLLTKEESTKNLYKRMPDFEREIKRKKTNKILWVRRILGIPNMRVKLMKEGDLMFTYGCLLFTNKPYCVYIENGLGLYRYDLGISRNPIARMFVSFLVKRKNCKKLIFMSKTAQKSFFSSVKYSKKTTEIIKKKSTQCYPMMTIQDPREPKKVTDGKKLKLLFAGTFYIKGGIEVINAFEKLKRKYPDLELTIITQELTLKKSHIDKIRSINGVTLHNAAFKPEQMNEFFQTHDVFLIPTYRDSFGAILIEVLPFGMPIITTDQYATTEMVTDEHNGFVYPGHPLKDYDTQTFRMLNKYINPSDFYADLFELQETGKMKPIEDFIYNSVEKFIQNPELVEKFSKNSIELYKKKFHYELISDRIESIFLEAIEK